MGTISSYIRDFRDLLSDDTVAVNERSSDKVLLSSGRDHAIIRRDMQSFPESLICRDSGSKALSL